MRRLLGALILLVVGCSTTALETTTTAAPATTTTTIPTTTTTRAAAVDECPPAPYEIGWLPAGVGDGGLDPSLVEQDEWTTEGGTQSTFYGRNDGTLAIALIRGTLPVIDWPGEKGIVQIDGVDAAVGPHPDGKWVAVWYVEPAARCDEYTMVFYPPWNPQDVEAVLGSMVRVAG